MNILSHIGMPTLLEIRSVEETAELCRRLGLSIIELNMTRPEFLPQSLEPERIQELSAK